ncbi:hypothetical protein BH23ACT12_BH23ACT12_20640 [soil metagenome]
MTDTCAECNTTIDESTCSDPDNLGLPAAAAYEGRLYCDVCAGFVRPAPIAWLRGDLRAML